MGALLIGEEAALYVVMAVALVVWLGIFAYLWMLDRRIRHLEEALRRSERVRGQ
ncbi:MAG: CcmD family protein [Chloroflexia bacterium]